MPQAEVVVEKVGPAGWLTFSNPERFNAVSYEMWESVPDLMRQLADDPEVRAVVLRGAGDKAFVSGADISQFEHRRGTADARDAYEVAVKQANAAIQACPKPTIAMIRGYCIGGGLGIALGCDLRFADRTSRFAIPAAKLGLGYAYPGVKLLSDLVGPAFAKEIFFTARQFDAAEALAMGLVNRVVEAPDLDALVRDTLERIGANAPMTIAAAKLAVDTANRDPDGKDVAEVRRAVVACFESEDYREGRAAFMEKRKPAFRGR